MKLISDHKIKINSLCKSHFVSQLYVFGSILTDKFNDESDVDMLIQFTSIEIKDYFDNYMNLKYSLEELLNRQVDLVENQAVKNPIFRKILDRDKQLIYG